MPSRRPPAWAWLLALAVALRPGLELFRLATASPTLPQWDMAKYGVSGLRLADALRDLDVFGWLARVHELDVWPPTWPLVESLAFLVFGSDVSVARGLVAVSWMLLVVAVFWALSVADSVAESVAESVGEGAVQAERSCWAALLAAAWVAQAPLLQGLATVNLLEVPGLLYFFVALGAYLRALRTDADGWWRATWIASLVLFFCKYNYGLMWLVPLVAAELRRREGSWRAVAARGFGALRTLGRARGGDRALAAGGAVSVLGILALFAWLRFRGPLSWTLFGEKVSMSSVGTPVYALFLLLVGRWIWVRVRSVESFGTYRRRLDATTRGAFTWLVLPIGLWFLLPPHVKELVGFVGNRSSESVPWSAEWWIFYPRAVVGDYAATPWIGVAVLILALVGLLRAGESSDERRVVALAMVVAWLAILVHPYRLPRFAAQAAVLTGVVAARGLVAMLPRPTTRRHRGVGRAVAVVAVLFAAWNGVSAERVAAEHGQRSVPASMAPLVEASARASLDGAVLLGTWNLHSPWTVEWQARRMAERPSSWHPAGRRELAETPALDAVIRGLRHPAIRQVAWIEADHPGWREENGWLAPLGERIDGSPAAERVWALAAESDEGWSQSVRLYRRVP